MRRSSPRVRSIAALGALAAGLVLGGCAYFNTFYSAKRNFDAAERLYQNPDDRANPQQGALYDKAIVSAAKLVAGYPTSKWVDDAVLITGRSLLGKGEYDKARKTFNELAVKFPQSPFLDQAIYYSAESYRRERKWDTAQVYYDSLRKTYPQSKLLPEATLRQAQLLLAQLRPRDAVAVLRPLDLRKLSDRAVYEWHRTLADAYYAVPSYDSARVEYAWVAAEAKTPEAFHEAMLRQGDALEGARRYAAAAEHYREYERVARTATYRDQASIRRASALAAGGKVRDGLQLLRDIVNDKQRLSVAPEALYRIGFIQEVQSEDAVAARATYAKVQETYRSSPFARQAEQRVTNLDKMDALRAAASSDTTGREQAAAAAFAVAERFLVDVERPDRAIEEYAKVESEFPETQTAAKASFASSWVFYRKLQSRTAADSVWKHLVRRYPETLYGRAASAMLRGKEDSLRTVGSFGSTLIKVPFSPNSQLYTPPEMKLTAQRPATSRADSLQRARQARADSLRARILPDSLRGRAPADTSRTRAPADTSRGGAPADTAKGIAPAPAPPAPAPPVPAPSSGRTER